MLTEDELRLAVAKLVGNAAPCDLLERLRRELRRHSDNNGAYRKNRRAYIAEVRPWADEHLTAALSDLDPPLIGFDVFKTFLRDTTGSDEDPGKPRMFYRALEECGWRLTHDGVRVLLPGAELLP